MLNKKGDEVQINIKKPIPVLMHEYANYIRVSEEFYEWAFSTLEERRRKEEEEE
jgi:hypothetical protein